MITTKVDIPDQQRSVLIVVIEKDNFERMKSGDPITLEHHGCVMPSVRFPDKLDIVIAYEEDDVTLYRLAKSGGQEEILRYITRNYKINPEVDGQAVDLKGK